MYFEIIGKIIHIEIIAISHSIRELTQLREQYGAGRWRKLKATATVRLSNDYVRQAEIHWYDTVLEINR